MPIANRVAPDGTLHAAPARGMLTGNRGAIHVPATRKASGRRWTTRAWIACSLEWKDERRDVWGANGRDGRPGWSELFFLDEVTALAAGHRPCSHCRRGDALRFRAAAGGLAAPQCDALLHAERWLSGSRPLMPLTASAAASLPDGAMVEADGMFHALKGGLALPWSFNGYRNPVAIGSKMGCLRLVTPPLMVAALANGYRPIWHESAALVQDGDHSARQYAGQD